MQFRLSSVSYLNWRILANLAEVVVDRGLREARLCCSNQFANNYYGANDRKSGANDCKSGANKVQNQVIQYMSFAKNLPSFAKNLPSFAEESPSFT